ncbi:hypothetical protein RQP46_000414 [Phenoliferia psychrophenolica]
MIHLPPPRPRPKSLPPSSHLTVASSFLEDGVFGESNERETQSGEDLSSAAEAAGGSAHQRQFAFRADSSISTPSSGNDSPEVFSPFTQAESSLTSASTSPPFTDAGRGHGPLAAMQVPPHSHAEASSKPQPFDWRAGALGGPFTVDSGGGQSSSAGPSHPPYLAMDPSHPHSSLPPGMNPYLATLAHSFPAQPAPEWQQHHPQLHHPTPLSNSYSGERSPLLFQPPPSLSHFSGNHSPNPMNPYAHSPFANSDQSLLSLHMSLEAQAQARQSGAAASGSQQALPPSSVAAAVDRMQRASAANSGLERPATKRTTSSSSSVKHGSNGKAAGSAVAAHLRGQSHPSSSSQALPSPPITGASHGLYAQHFADQASPFPAVGSAASFQRPLPPLPRRTGTLPQSATSPTASTPGSPYSHLPHSRAASILGPTPPASRPASPRPAGVDYDFSSLEKDLDRFSSGGFASAAAAAMASVGPNNRKGHKTSGGFGAGGYSSPQSPYIEGASPRVVHDVLSESVYASLPPRSPAASANGASPSGGGAPTPSDSGQYVRGGGGGFIPGGSPAGDTASPTGSTIIDEEAAEALSRKDPIAAQVWRMFNKAKNTLPNGARMENLTWRLMSMTLKKRKEETAAAAEAEALAANLLAEELAREELDGLDELGVGLHGDVARKPTIKGKEKAAEQFLCGDVGEDDESRDITMDWRAQSRSRSRLRAPVAPPTLSAPEVTTTPVTANLSRFYGDAGSSTIDTVHQDFAASLGLSPNDDLFGPSNGFDPHALDYSQQHRAPSVLSPSYGNSPPSLNPVSPSAFAFPADPASPPGTTAANTDANLAAIESTLNQLISLQSIAISSPHPGSSWMPSPSPITSTSPAKASAPIATFAPHSFHDVVPKTEDDGLYNLGPSDRGVQYGGEASTSQPSTSSQLQLQHLANQVRKAGLASQLSSSLPRPSSSPYLNATTLSQSARPFSFAQSVASGLSLARPTNVLPEAFHAPSPELYSAPPTPSHIYPSSAPAHHNFLNASTPSYFDSHDSQSPYDYFHHTSPDNSYGSPYDYAPTHVNPSQLLALQGSSAGINGTYDSESAWGGFSPASAFSPTSGNEDEARSTPSPHEGANPTHPRQQKSHPARRSNSLAGQALHSASSPDLAGLASVPSNSKSAPGSRTHSRSNTISLPQSIYEGKPLASAPPKDTDVPPPIGAGLTDESAITCLNCKTTNTPLWRRDADGRPLCNACGLFRNLHGVDRPANLNTGVIKKRNRARGPKDAAPKKNGSSGRAAARRNSLGGPPVAATGRATPYPSTAVRQGQTS